MLFSHGVMVCHIIFRGAVEKTFSTVLSVRKRCGVLHRKDMRQSVPVFPSQMVEIREILWVWKRKVIRQTTLVRSPRSNVPESVSGHVPWQPLQGSVAAALMDITRPLRGTSSEGWGPRHYGMTSPM